MRPDEAGPGRGSVPIRMSGIAKQEVQLMKTAAVPDTAIVAAAPRPPGDEAQKRAIAKAVWTELLWLMPHDRTVTIAVTGGDVAVELGPPAAVPAH